MKKQLIENIDFYINEEGLMVLTASFLREKGYCCKNGCFHCPYRQQSVINVVDIDADSKNEKRDKK